VQTFIGSEDWIATVFVSGNYLYSGCVSSRGSQWLISTGQKIRDFGNSQVKSLLVYDGVIFAAEGPLSYSRYNATNCEKLNVVKGMSCCS
jgi:hypothetical protein